MATRHIRVLAFVATVSCGEARGILGDECVDGDDCDSGLVCNIDNTCSDAHSDIRIIISAPDPFAVAGLTTCAERATLGDELIVVLDVGGAESCEVDLGSALTVDDGCTTAPAGIVRPVGLGYYHPPPAGGQRVLLFYGVGWVDLTDAVLPSSAAVTVSMPGDGMQSVLLYSPAGYDSLASGTDCDGLTDGATLCTAEMWARERLKSGEFDRDGDTETNATEACNGTLF